MAWRELKKEDFIGKAVYSDLERTGYIKTSNQKVNKLYSNCLWGQKSNFLDIPTDCPQRDERLGWTGDAAVFAPTASYNMDTRAFFKKFLNNIGREQRNLDGAVPIFVPSFGAHMVSNVWSDIAAFLPALLYDYYGDKKVN